MRRFTDNAKPRVQIPKVDTRVESERQMTLETQSMLATQQYLKQNVKKVKEIETHLKEANAAVSAAA
jgi:hypothetical protein